MQTDIRNTLGGNPRRNPLPDPARLRRIMIARKQMPYDIALF